MITTKVFQALLATTLLLATIALMPLQAEAAVHKTARIQMTGVLEVSNGTKIKNVEFEINGNATCENNVMTFKGLRAIMTVDGKSQRTSLVWIRDIDDHTTRYSITTKSLGRLLVTSNYYGLVDCAYITLNGGLFVRENVGSLNVDGVVYQINSEVGYTGFRYLQ